MPKTSITVTTEIELTVETAAKWFVGLSDEQQADFFVEAAKASLAWGPLWAGQYYSAGRHLRDCECSTNEARELVKTLAEGLVPD